MKSKITEKHFSMLLDEIVSIVKELNKIQVKELINTIEEFKEK